MPVIIAAGIGAAATAYSANKSAQSVNKQIKFQKDMSDTAIQRQVQDMRAAGINPILAGKYGGASTPSGAMYQHPDMGQSMAALANTAIQSQQTQANITKIEQEVSNLKTTQGWTETQIRKASIEIGKLETEIEMLRTQTAGQNIENMRNQMILDYYQSDKGAMVAKELGVAPARWFETLQEYFRGSASPNNKVDGKGASGAGIFNR